MSDEPDPRSQAHPRYPTLAAKAWQWATDGMLEGFGDGHEWTTEDDELGEALEDAICSLMCARFGHQVEDDQCGIPSHRYCLWCRHGMPNEPIGRKAPE